VLGHVIGNHNVRAIAQKAAMILKSPNPQIPVDPVALRVKILYSSGGNTCPTFRTYRHGFLLSDSDFYPYLVPNGTFSERPFRGGIWVETRVKRFGLCQTFSEAV
jgi:hypothetical protein